MTRHGINTNLNAKLSDFYMFNLRCGAKKINKKEGLKRIVNGIDYFRCLEDPLVSNNLKLERGLTLLDIGSSTTTFPLFIASKGVQVWATDIDDSVLKLREVAKNLKSLTSVQGYKMQGICLFQIIILIVYVRYQP